MTNAEQRAEATKFYNNWHGKGDEKSDCQRFWIEFCTNILGVDNVTQKLVFEKRVLIHGQTKYIDVYIPETRVLIEQKSFDKSLNKKYLQSDGNSLTPFEQGRNYAQWMIPDETPLWIVTCNFQSFEIHNMNKPQEEPLVITLEEVRSKFSLLGFMFRKEVKEISREMEISVKAGELVGILYDKLLKQYKEPDEKTLVSLNTVCVRLVFCLYADHADVFGSHLMFQDYLKDIPVMGFRKALMELFKILDTRVEDRDKYLVEDNPRLAAFPYVNGGLFADENIEIPPFTEEIKDILLNKASADFNWSEISPTIFGAVFESTLNPETRRSGGMHYTSIENIHKVIDPLFLNDLREELSAIKNIAVDKTRKARLSSLQDKIASLKFLDPACGSGNFLTETYISLRRIENEIIIALLGQQIVIGEAIKPIKVSIGQFYGIEINDFAVTVAKTALWIAESQMMRETEDIVHMNLDFLPLKTNAYIIEGNALRVDWKSIIPKNELSYIMGNPPFIGARWQNAEQKEDIINIFDGWKNAGDLDYVCCWYKKAFDYCQNTKIECALVSTNSITQGSAVINLWKSLFDEGVVINFAHRSFQWDSEASLKAHVHCVIIGFSNNFHRANKIIYEGEHIIKSSNISGYLTNTKNIFIENRNKPICEVPIIGMGNQPIDNGYYLFTQEEMDEFIKKEPLSQPYFHRWYGAQEFINNTTRYCLWLGKCTPAELRKMPYCLKLVEAVRKYRSESKRMSTKKLADKPTRFQTENMPTSNYIVIPEVSSEKRIYIPIGFMTPEVLCSNKLRLMPSASLYHFGVLNSNVHNAWIRAVCGRLETRYDYSIKIVYNNFPWCIPTESQRKKIEQTAQEILNARALYPESSLADLYDEITMPIELRKAHQQNDKAVMEAYGFPIKDMTEENCVAELMNRYQQITSN